MRVACEYIFDSNKVLIRLLGTPGNPDIQLGTYSVKFIQTRDPIQFDIEAEQIVNNEAKIYLSALNPLPESLTITLPDASIVEALIELVKKPPPEKLIAEQNLETITPREQVPHYPAHAEYNPDDLKMSPPEYPPFWIELDFTNANPLKAGKGLTPPTLAYTGGGPGRILSSTQKQEALDFPPYKIQAPLHLEGEATNSLQYSDFATSYIPPGFLDAVPTGWSVQLADTDNLIRVYINDNPEGVILPSMKLYWYQRPGYQDFTLTPPVRVVTPNVAANHTFQIILIPDPRNEIGQAQLRSATNLFQTAMTLLQGPTVMTLNVGADAGPVTIVWNQPEGNGSPQTLELVGPQATEYTTVHTLLPYGVTSEEDVLTVTGVQYSSNWILTKGFIRLDSETEILNQPVSWNIKFQSGETFLQVQNGILSSDFSTLALSLSSYLAPDLSVNGSYKLRWDGSSDFKMATRLPGEPEQIATIPFNFDLPIPESVLTEQMIYEFRSFVPTAGSSRLKYFIFKPE